MVGRPRRRLAPAPHPARTTLALIVLLAACSDDADEPALPTTTTTAATTTSATPYRVGRLSPGALVEGRDEWLTPPKDPTTKTFAGDCRSLADPGWEVSCERVADAVWIVERQRQQERVLIWVKRTEEAWDLALRASDDTGTEFDAEVSAADLAGDGHPKMVVELRETLRQEDAEAGLSGALHVAVVEPDGTIVVGLVLGAGRSGRPQATPKPGQGLEVVDCPADCVPTAPMRTRLVAYRDNAWRVVHDDWPYH